MNDFGLIVLGFFLGCAFSFVMIGSGIWYGERVNKRELADDSDMRIYFPSRSRDRSGDNRCNKQVEAEEEKGGNGMTRSDSEARIIALAEKLHVKIITRKENADDERSSKHRISHKL